MLAIAEDSSSLDEKRIESYLAYVVAGADLLAELDEKRIEKARA